MNFFQFSGEEHQNRDHPLPGHVSGRAIRHSHGRRQPERQHQSPRHPRFGCRSEIKRFVVID